MTVNSENCMRSSCVGYLLILAIPVSWLLRCYDVFPCLYSTARSKINLLLPFLPFFFFFSSSSAASFFFLLYRSIEAIWTPLLRFRNVSGQKMALMCVYCLGFREIFCERYLGKWPIEVSCSICSLMVTPLCPCIMPLVCTFHVSHWDY